MPSEQSDDPGRQLMERRHVGRLYRTAARDWSTYISRDPHDVKPGEGQDFTFSVERTLDGERQVLVEGVSPALAHAIESTLDTLEALLAEALNEGPQ